MGLIGAIAGYCFSYSLRLAIFGLVVALTLLVSQGLFLKPRTLCRRCSGGPSAASRRCSGR